MFNSVFDFAPQVVDRKFRYRDEEPRKKHTYNFVTSQKMKRGHNFGVVYVTNPTNEEPHPEPTKYIKKENATSKQVELEVPRPPKGRENMGVNTSPVNSTVRPKPLTFEMGVQIDLYIDRPQTPLFWPQKTGTDISTQVEDGELFHFDEEVEPILSVLLSKILEQSRMEVLEEEEIKEMKRKQREFEEIRNREETEVQILEDKEAREIAEKNRRVAQKQLEKENKIISQKKLFTRQFAKEYLSKLKSSAISQLDDRGFFRPKLLNQLHKLGTFLMSEAEINHQNDFIVVNQLHQSFVHNFENQQRKAHAKAIVARQQKIIDSKRAQLEEEERKRQEKIERKAERARLKREKEIQKLKNAIEEEFLKKMDLVDLPDFVFNINGYGQKRPYASAIGGYFGQFALLLSYCSKAGVSFTEDKLIKVLDLFFKNCPNFSILYSQEDLEHYKTIDSSINIIEDILKLDESLYTEISRQIKEKISVYDELLHPLFELVSQIEIESESKILNNVQDNYELFLNCLMKKAKSPEQGQKIVFVLKENPSEEQSCLAIGQVFPVSVPNGRADKKIKKTKAAFEPFFPEKVGVFPSCSEKSLFLAVNLPFETMLRANIIECINRVQKFEQDVEKVKEEYEEFYIKNVARVFIEDLANKLNKEILKFEDVDLAA